MVGDKAVRGSTCYHVRLQAEDRRYWHWKLAKRDRLDVFHAGKWYVMVSWTDLLLEDHPTAEVILVLRSELRGSLGSVKSLSSRSESSSAATTRALGHGRAH